MLKLPNNQGNVYSFMTGAGEDFTKDQERGGRFSA